MSTNAGLLDAAIWKLLLRRIALYTFGVVATLEFFFVACAQAAHDGGQGSIEQVVNEAIRSLMKDHAIPGMAVAVTVNGKRHFFNYGVASKESGQKATENGSVANDLFQSFSYGGRSHSSGDRDVQGQAF
jgi:CubicO group peptidase (beta-lactamase class C family)